MTGITLSLEQIRTALPKVRRWIEREVMTSHVRGPELDRDGRAL